VRERIHTRTVDSLALEVYRAGGGNREIADADRRSALIRHVWASRRQRLGGLSEIGLQEEFDYILIGRSIGDLETYLELPRTGRGSALSAPAREAVWEAHDEYSRAMGRDGLTHFSEVRRDALATLRDGRATRQFAAVVADEAQDLGENAVQLLLEVAGGLPDPNLTLVGDGQQSIYPGGFSLLQQGIDVRGRATVLRTNWRNTHAIWKAAQAFIAGEGFDELEEPDPRMRSSDEVPMPMRDGQPPGLWCASAGEEFAMAAEVVAESLALGADPGNCAVLAPSNAQVRALRSALQASGVATEDLSAYEGRHGAAVWTGTFHRAKGLEFKHVVVAGLSARTWPPRRPGLDVVARSEARARDVRAAFVAMTRARDRLDVVVGGAPAPELEHARDAFDRR
jgi:superfamily I DNA/RNA helicase